MDFISWVVSLIGQVGAFFKNNYEAIIAICALGFTAFEAHTTRKHNRLSLKPKLSIRLNVDRTAINDDLIVLEYRLKNAGIGPGEIKRIEFFFKGNSISKDFESMAHFLDHKIDEIMDKYEAPLGGYIFNHFLGPGIIIDAQSEDAILSFKCREWTPDTWGALEDVFKDLSVKMEYVSLYGETFSFLRNEESLTSPKSS